MSLFLTQESYSNSVLDIKESKSIKNDKDLSEVNTEVSNMLHLFSIIKSFNNHGSKWNNRQKTQIYLFMWKVWHQLLNLLLKLELTWTLSCVNFSLFLKHMTSHQQVLGECNWVYVVITKNISKKCQEEESKMTYQNIFSRFLLF